MLSGLLVCGRCGRRMTAVYSGGERTYFTYACAGRRDHGEGSCWSVAGTAIDAAIDHLFLATMAPDELELSLAVERDVRSHRIELDRAWQTRIEQARYQALRAERRYKAVDPDNRVVARSLERDWEQALRALEELVQEHERVRAKQRLELSDADRLAVCALAKELPKVWRASTTTPADRKAMLRLVIEAIGIRPVEVPHRVTALRVQWQSGHLTELVIPRPDRAQRTRTAPSTVARLRALAQTGLRDEQIADQLNAEGFVTGKDRSWTAWAIRWARRKEGIERHYPDQPRRAPLPKRHPDGRYSVAGVAERLRVSIDQVRRWIDRGLVDAQREDFEQHRGVYWVRLDRATVRRLAKLSTT